MISSEHLAAGNEAVQALLVLLFVFAGWRAAGMLLRALGTAQAFSKAEEGSASFRVEVAAFAKEHSVEDASKHSGLSPAEVVQCQSEAAQLAGAVTQIFTAARSLFTAGPETSMTSIETMEAVEHDDDVVARTSVSQDTRHHAGLRLLEHYGVFGATSGTWSGPLTC